MNAANQETMNIQLPREMERTRWVNRHHFGHESVVSETF